MTQQGNDKIGRDKQPAFVGKHNPVCVSVKDNAYVALFFFNQCLELFNVFWDQRVGCMVGESAIQSGINIKHIVMTKQPLNEQAGHTI